MDRKAYLGLTKVYTTAIGKLYDRDIRNFLEEAKLHIIGSSGITYLYFLKMVPSLYLFFIFCSTIIFFISFIEFNNKTII